MTKTAPFPPFPISRPRRLRQSPALREMLRETILTPKDFIYPLFVRHGEGIKEEIASMPGQFQWSVDLLAEEAVSIAELGIPAVILFGIPAEKDPIGLENFAPDGIIQESIRAIKAAAPEMVVISDVRLCEYTDHGHCGIIEDGEVSNDPSVERLAATALSHARAGADIVAPSLDALDFLAIEAGSNLSSEIRQRQANGSSFRR